MKKQNALATCIAACAVEGRFVYLATTLDDLDREQLFSRMSFLDNRSGAEWFYHDLPGWRVVSVCLLPASPDSPRLACALSEEGQIELYGRDSTAFERIPDAGLDGPASAGYGYLNRIRCIGGMLYACGSSGQIYRRPSPDHWEHFDMGLLQDRTPLQAAARQLQAGADFSALASLTPMLDLLDIGGLGAQDLYCVGSGGSVFHHGGRAWTKVDVGIDDDLTAIHYASKEEVWICGSNGQLLVGSASQGFKNVSGVDDNQSFRSLVKFRGIVYLASDSDLFAFDGNRISRIDPPLSPGLQDANCVLSIDNSELWSIGFKDFVRFDGQRWERIQHPDNPII